MKSDLSVALRSLRGQFAEQLSARVATIDAAFHRLNPGDWKTSEAHALHRLLHNLTGSAGTFGRQSVSDAARSMADRLAAMLKLECAPADADWQALGTTLRQLKQQSQIRFDVNAPSLEPPVLSQRVSRSPLIFLVEDDPAQAEQLTQLLLEDGYRVQGFASPAEFRDALAVPGAERPAAVLMDMMFPEGDEAGAAVIAELGIGDDPRIAVVVVSVRDDLPGRLAAFRAGASRYLTKPVDGDRLTVLLDELTGRQPPDPYRVLLVDDDALLLAAHAEVLGAAGMQVATLSDPLQTLDLVDEFDPDVLVLDVYMQAASGPELAALLRERDAQLHLPILFLSTETDINQQLLALNLGGDDFLVKPVRPDHLVAAVIARARRARQNSVLHKRLQTTLYEREREHLALDQHAIVSIADRAGNITYVNDKYCRIAGYARDELLGRPLGIVDAELQAPEMTQALWHDIASGHVWHGEISKRRKDGSLYWVEVTITPFLDSYDEPYQYVSIMTDVSHLKEAQNRLALFGRIFDVTEQAIGIAGPAGTMVYANPAFQRLFGYLQHELVTLPFSSFLADEAKDLEPIFMGAISRGESWTGLLPQRRKNGVEFISASSIGAILDGQGKPQYLFNILSDYTPELERQREMLIARDEADRANQAKSEFLSNMSHELRTPMNSILGFSQLMEDDPTLSSDQQDNLSEILRAGHHLLGLINEVLDLAKIESGQLDLSIEPVAVVPVVEECLALLRTQAQQRQIRITHEVHPDAAVRADRNRLKQALLNLISNAVKYNREGGSVRVDACPEGTQQLRIRVTDTGQGIPAHRLPELFQPFHRLEAESSEIEGTGIGLTITRRIVEMMGGTVNVASEPGVGSRFWIDLPLESIADSDHGDADPASAAMPLGQSSTGREHLVLYIEDNPSNIKLMAQILGRRPHIKLLTAHTPVLGLELAMAHQPELILLDVNMPGMNGYQVLKVLRADARSKHIPVAAVTANAMPSDIQRGVAEGFVEYLTKPLNVDRLYRLLERTFRERNEGDA